MSLRWELYGFDLDHLRTLVSGDRRANADRFAVEAEAREIELQGGQRDAETLAYARACADVVRRAVGSGVPFGELGAEGPEHVAAARFLAGVGQRLWPEVESWKWKHGAWQAFHDATAERFPPDARSLLDGLVFGRPLFGTDIDTGWEHYSHFSNVEARVLSVALRQVRGERPDLHDDENIGVFPDALQGWLDEIAAAGRDVFVFAQ